MNNWKRELRRTFAAPPPQRKREFLRQWGMPRMSVFRFLLTQTGYIRKWVWCVSALIFAAAVVGAGVLSRNMLWEISALTPLLALAAVCESGRSECYEMAELELATRFSLRSVTMARLCILGAENLVLLCLLTLLGLWHSGFPSPAAGVYILTPFLLTSFLGLYALRRIRGREGVSVCAGLALFISVSVFFTHNSFPYLYAESCLSWWIAGALALCAGIAVQYATMLKQTEELAWN